MAATATAQQSDVMVSTHSKRLAGLDVLRGFLMLYITFLHPLIQRVFSQDASEFSTQVEAIPGIFIMLLSPVIMLSLWGPIFILLSGFSTAYQMTLQVRSGRHNLGSLLKQKIFTSVLIWLSHIFFMLFFTNQSPDFGTTSLITGRLEIGYMTNAQSGFNLIHIFTSGTLESIAISNIFISLILFAVLKRAERKTRKNKALAKIIIATRYKKAAWVFGIITIVVFAAAYVVYTFLPDAPIIAASFLSEGKYLAYFLFARTFTIRFALIPILAFASMGALLGTILGSGEGFPVFARIGLNYAVFFVILFIGYLFTGFNIIGGFASETVPLPLQFLNISAQIIVIIIILSAFDYPNSLQVQNRKSKVNIDKIRKRAHTIFSRFNATSLTIFVFEPFLSIIWYRLFFTIAKGPISENFVFIILFELCVMGTWFGLLMLWHKVSYKFSIEYFIGIAKKKYKAHLGKKEKRSYSIRRLGGFLPLFL